MARRRIQNIVAKSALTLPLSATLAVLLCSPWPIHSPGQALPLILMTLAAYTLFEWGNRFQIIRVRTRLTTSLYLMGMTAITLVAGASAHSIALSLAVMLAIAGLSTGYAQYQPVASALHTGVCLSCAALMCTPMLWLLPVALLCMAIYIRSLTPRTLSALLLGALFPWVVAMAWPLLLHPATQHIEPEQLLPALASLVPTPAMPSLPHPSMPQAIVWAAVSAIQGISLLCFILSVPDDKIRTRQLLHMTALLWLSIQAVMLLSPTAARSLLPTLWIVGCPLLSHHLALSHTWGTTLHFMLVILTWAAAVATHIIYII